MEVDEESNIVKENAIREDLVVTAVKFLQNVKVSNSPLDMKRTFLTKKGLTEAEIREAFTRLGPMMKTIQQDQQMYSLLPQNSIGSKIRDILNILLLIGGFSYTIRYLWKKYISQWLFGKQKREKTPHELLLESSNKMLTTVEALQKSMTVFETSIERYSTKLETVSEQIKQLNTSESARKNEIKAEIQSLKGLFLSSRSFPQHTISPPSLPSWQLEKGKAKDVKEEGKKSSDSSSSEIDMINVDSPNTSGEDVQ